MLLSWMDVAAGRDAEFNDWYTHEHIPERASVPGFLRARRYVRADAPGAPACGQAYFTLYETRSLDVLASSEYLAFLNNPTQWTRRAITSLTNVNRTAARVEASLGSGMGAHLSTVEVTPLDSSSIDESLTVLAGELLATNPSVTGVHVLRGDEATSSQRGRTREGRLSAVKEVSRLTLAVEGQADIRRALSGALSTSGLLADGFQIKSYTFMFGIVT